MSPFRPLPGIFFFDAWRISPTLAQTLAPTAVQSDEPPLGEPDVEDESPDSSRGSYVQAKQEAVPDKDTYELSYSATVALQAIDAPLRERFHAQSKDGALDLGLLEHVDQIALAYLDVKNDWPWAKVGFNLEKVCSKFEGVMRLIFQEQQLRDPDRSQGVMDNAKFTIFNQFIRFLAGLVTHTVGLGREALETFHRMQNTCSTRNSGADA